MPLIEFQAEDKWGLKNTSGVILVEPIYDYMCLTEKGAVGMYFKKDDIEDDNVDETENDSGGYQIFLIDHSGDIIINISEKLENQSVDHVLEIWHLKNSIFCFLYSNWDGMELLGAFDDHGNLIARPQYDDIDAISDYLLLCTNAGRYDMFDEFGDFSEGIKLYNIYGEKLDPNAIKSYEELPNGEFLFETTSYSKFKTDRFGNKLMIK